MQFSKLLSYFDEWNGRQSVTHHGLEFCDGGVVGCFDGIRLNSAFQPILHAGSLLPFAHEALLRAQFSDGAYIPPQDVFSASLDGQEVLYLDRLCRIVHAINFFTQNEDPNQILFLNVDGRHLLNVSNGGHGHAFLTLLEYCGLKPQQVVLEIVESLVADSSHLIDAISGYQKLGYQIAIDDFGSRESNFDRLWQLSPDIVKLDRTLVTQSEINSRARRVLPKLVEIIHDLGARVVCEGIETREQHDIAIQTGTDYVQGYIYGKPSALISSGSVTSISLEHLKRQSNPFRQTIKEALA